MIAIAADLEANENAKVDQDRVATSSQQSAPEKLSSTIESADKNEISKFVKQKHRVIRDDEAELQLTLQHDETVIVEGVYDLIVSNGIVTVYGAVVRAGSPTQRVYAPSSHVLPQIQARQDETLIRLLSCGSFGERL